MSLAEMESQERAFKSFKQFLTESREAMGDITEIQMHPETFAQLHGFDTFDHGFVVSEEDGLTILRRKDA